MSDAYLKLFLFFGALLLCLTSSAQIVNIYKKRLQLDSTGWGGSVQLGMSAERNVQNNFSLYPGGLLYHEGVDDSWLVLAEYKLISAGGDDLINSAFGHISYDNDLAERIEMEVSHRFNTIASRKYRHVH